MPSFVPTRCPHPACPSTRTGHFRWQRRGHFTRRCDGRQVPRFACHECRRSFSSQTFRLDYRLKRPRLHLELFPLFISKVTHRQAARVLGCTRKSVAHRLQLLGRHARRFHRRQLQCVAAGRGLKGTFQLDELETFEHNRRLSPLTVPVLIERSSYFVLWTQPATLPARGPLSPAHREQKLARDRLQGVRRSGSRMAVRQCLDRLAAVHRREEVVEVQTDRKASYASELRRTFGERILHSQFPSNRRRDYSNPLFPINLTLAMLRDGLSRLVRRTWAASKRSSRLRWHLWIWIAWRNYVRGITNCARRTTPAMALGVMASKLRVADLCAWRVLDS